MLERLDSYRGLTLHALDGELGRVEDFYFDDDQWTIRYVVVSTRAWLGRHVLISPIDIGEPDWVDDKLDVQLTRDQIRNSPEVPARDAFDRDAQAAVARHYGIPAYWQGPHLWGSAAAPRSLRERPLPSTTGDAAPNVDRGWMLHSLRSLRGLHVHARDGEIGHVDDVFADQETWRMRYVLVDTSNWIGGIHVMVPTELADDVDWLDQRLTVDTARDRIRSAPRYDAARPLDRTFEEALARHYDLIARTATARGR